MVNTEKKHAIWSNNIDIEDWQNDIKEWYGDDELTDDEIYNLAYENNMDNLEADKCNLSKELGRDIVIIGQLGLWNGVRKAWKYANGTNLNDIFNGTCGDYVTWYVDENGEVCCEDIHHDGTNYYTYRLVKEGISRWEFDEEMALGTNIDELTDKLGKYVADIYGWKN